jgi:hypothetical protein
MDYLPPDKESAENDATGGDELAIVEDGGTTEVGGEIIISSAPMASLPVDSSTSSPTSYPPTSSPTIDAQRAYEGRFAPPKSSQAMTTYTLLSDPLFFTRDRIRNRTHHLFGSLNGTLWLDVNNDGVRGSASNLTINAMEFDTGVNGVSTYLVGCDDDVVVTSTRSGGYGASSSSSFTSAVDGDDDDGNVTEGKMTDFPDAGRYEFRIRGEGVDSSSIFSSSSLHRGRYYVMYKAPRGYRMGGNVLPLGRTSSGGTGEEEDDDDFDCVPRGGEGLGYVDEASLIGDLDWGGYCARSIGCLDVEWLFNLRERYGNVTFADGTKEEDAYTLYVAYPSTSTLDVGLAREEWPLGTDQYADSELSFSFPSGTTEEDLESIVGAPEEFGKNPLRDMLEKNLLEYFKENDIGGDFDLRGIDLHSGKISTNKEAVTTTRSLRSLLMRRRGLDGGGDGEGSGGDSGATVTYAYTTRGKYNPPPFEQIGEIVSDSIDADPMGVVKSLGNRAGDGTTDDGGTSEIQIPPVFAKSQGAVSRHLSLKKPPSPVVVVPYSIIEGWATVPIVLLAASIAALVGALLYRRWRGRPVSTKTSAVDDDPFNPFKAYLDKGSGYAVTKSLPDDDKGARSVCDSRDTPPRDKKEGRNTKKKATGSVNSSDASSSRSRDRAKGKPKNGVANSFSSNGTSLSSTGSAYTAAKRGDGVTPRPPSGPSAATQQRHEQLAFEAQIADQAQMIQPVRSRRTNMNGGSGRAVGVDPSHGREASNARRTH